MTIGEKIKFLRQKNDITQEKLAEYLNISYQSISKWENDTTMPDIMLLPVIAGIFDVTVDTLFSIDGRAFPQKLSIENIPAAVYDGVLSTMWDWDRATVEEMSEKLKKQPETHTGIVSRHDNGVYVNKDMALVYLKGRTDSLQLLENEGAAELLLTLADATVRKLMKYQLENEGVSYTVASVSVKCGLCESDVKLALDRMVKYEFVIKQTVDLGSDETLDVYYPTGTHKMPLLVYPLLCLAERLSCFQESWYGFQNEPH